MYIGNIGKAKYRSVFMRGESLLSKGSQGKRVEILVEKLRITGMRGHKFNSILFSIRVTMCICDPQFLNFAALSLWLSFQYHKLCLLPCKGNLLSEINSPAYIPVLCLPIFSICKISTLFSRYQTCISPN